MPLDAAPAAKPLGRKAHGSTPHLPGSRLGPGDWTIHPGQAAIATERPRDGRDLVWVTEKLDGSCCAIACSGGRILALTRAGYLAETSPFRQHHLFAEWVAAREPQLRRTIGEGRRIVGEWLIQAHGLVYRPSEPRDLFCAFAAYSGPKRLPMVEMLDMAGRAGLREAAVLHRGGPLPIFDAVAALGDRGQHDATSLPEGAVWVVERDGAFDFAAKWVRPGKADGLLLPEISGAAEVWNWTGPLAPSGQETMPASPERDHV